MISAVVLQHNLSELTQVAVESIRESDRPIDELIIVDNGSTLENWQALTGLVNLDTRLIRLDENCGYVIGTNRGWQAARGDYILLCTNDVALSKQCVGRLVRMFEQDDRVGWVCAHYQDERAGMPDCATHFPIDVLMELNKSCGAKRDALNQWAAGMTEPTPPFSERLVTEATVFMVRKSASDAIGQFWEELTYFHSHDYGQRLIAAGYKMTTNPSAVFWHDPSHPTIRHATGGSIVSPGYERSLELYNERYGRH